MVETLERLIHQHPFFQDMEDQHVELISGCARNVHFDTGQIILREGEDATDVFLIREGLVAIELPTPTRGHIRVQTVGEGDVLGWSWLVPPYRWRFTARACRSTRALALDAQCLRTKCEQDHDLGYQFMKRFTSIVTDRLDATRLQLMELIV